VWASELDSVLTTLRTAYQHRVYSRAGAISTLHRWAPRQQVPNSTGVRLSAEAHAAPAAAARPLLQALTTTSSLVAVDSMSDTTAMAVFEPVSGQCCLDWCCLACGVAKLVIC